MMKGGIGQLMKQAKAMQENMAKAQQELAATEVTGEAGAGLVSVTMTCKHEVRSIRIDDSLISEDRDMLEDLLAAGFNDALRRAEEKSAEKMQGMAGGLDLPAGFKLPF
ncbi:MAG: YbaB/EbfC family nucleoid-associated protein [Pseudomonadota bacterium]